MLMLATAALLGGIRSETERLKNLILSSAADVPADAEVYYISPNGDDSADGRSPAGAWRTPGAAEAHGVGNGRGRAYVLFERGGLWRGGFRAHGGVTYSAYGSGEKPRFYGSALDGAADGAWERVSEKVWRFSEPVRYDCGSIVLDGKTHAKKLTIHYEGAAAKDHRTGCVFRGTESLFEDMTFWHDLGGRVMLSDEELLSGETGAGHLYFCSETDPSERFSEIEFLTRKNVIEVCGDNVCIDNLTIMYGGAHGIGAASSGGKPVKGLSVTNCVIAHIGGSVQFYAEGRPVRFGNGVEIWGSCEDDLIERCYIYDVYDAGVMHQYERGGEPVLMKNVAYRDNLIQNCTYAIEYFLGKAEGGAARSMENILISGNMLQGAGFGFGRERPDKETPALIKSWDCFNRTAGDGMIIRGNTLWGSTERLIHICADRKEWLPVLCGNTFLQKVGGLLGKYGANPCSDEMFDAEASRRDDYSGNDFYGISGD